MSTRALEWTGRLWQEGYLLECSFRLFAGENGYDNRVQQRVPIFEVERFGPSICNYYLQRMIDEVKTVLFRALCSDRDMMSLVRGWDRVRDAEQRAYDAECRADALQAKAQQYQRLMAAVADGDAS
jgi:hypothetical protein